MEVLFISVIVASAIYISYVFHRIDPMRPVRAAFVALLISLVSVAAISFVVTGRDLTYAALIFFMFGVWATPVSLIASAFFWLESVKKRRSRKSDS